jgi:hypothetical protein
MNLDEEALAILRELRPLINQHIDSAIAAAFSHIMSFAEVQKAYVGVDLEKAKQTQRQHWMDGVFATSFTEAQLAHSIAKPKHASAPAWRSAGFLFSGV